MRWLAFLTWVLVFVGAFALGRWLGSGEDDRGRKIATWTVGVCLLVILTRVVLRPSTEFAWFPFDFYAVIRPWWPLPFAFALLGVGTRQLKTANARKGIALFAALLFFASAYPLLRTALFDPRDLTGQVEADGVCRQTTSYTCGAAAASTLLAHHGIASSEREMAERCWTNALTGTDVFCVARGLRQKLEGTDRTVQLRTGGWETLQALREPALATIRWGLMVDHWVVVREVHDDRVVVGDPLQGVRTISKEEFLQAWRGGLVTVDR